MTQQATAPTCAHCRQPMDPGAASCRWCGAAYVPAAGPAALPPAAPVAVAAPVAAPLPVPAAGGVPPLPGLAPALAATAAPTPVVSATQPRPAPSTARLGDAFAGEPASAGSRLAALTVDTLVVAVVAGAVWLAASSVALGVVAAVEVIAALAVLEARTGLTVGNALLRIRTSRKEGPFSPGGLRLALRNVVLGAGFAVAAVGAWVVTLSSAWDPERRGRTWADMIGRTVAVSVPSRARGAGAPLPAGPRAPVVAPRYDTVPLASMPVAPLPASLAGLSADPLDHSAPTGHTRDTAAMPQAGAAVRPMPPVPALPPLASPAPTQPPALDAPPQHAEPRTMMLLVFDTGQRVQLPVPCAVVLGRRPAAIDPEDHLVEVDDPARTVSKSHLRLEHGRGGTWVTDLGSANGSRLTDDEGTAVRLAPQQRATVDDATRVRIGDRTFSISFVSDDSGRRDLA